MEIFRLFGSIFIENEKANKSLKDTDQQAEKVGKTLQETTKAAIKFGDELGKRLTDVGSKMTKVAGIPLAALKAAMLGLAKTTADYTDTVMDNARVVGLSAEAYQELQYAMAQSGLSQDDFVRMMGRVNQRIGMARQGNEKYRKSLQNLGISLEDVDKGLVGTEEAFIAMIDYLHQMEDSQQQAAVAGDFFGVMLARRMMPLIRDGAESVEELRQRAHELGLVMDDLAIAKGDLLSDTLDDLSFTVKGLGRIFGSEMHAPMINIANAITDVISRFSAWLTENPKVVRQIIVWGGAIAGVLGVLVTLGTTLIVTGKIVGALGTIFNLLISKPMLIIAAIGLLYLAWENDWGNIKTTTEAVVGVIIGLWDSLVEWWDKSPLLNRIREIWDDAVDLWNEMTLPEKALGLITITATITWGLTFIQTFLSALLAKTGITSAAGALATGAKFLFTLGALVVAANIIWNLIPEDIKDKVQELWQAVADAIESFNTRTINNPFISRVAEWLKGLDTEGWELPALTVGVTFTAFKLLQTGIALAAKLGAALAAALVSNPVALGVIAVTVAGISWFYSDDEERAKLIAKIEEIWTDEELSLVVKVGKITLEILEPVYRDITKQINEKIVEPIQGAWDNFMKQITGKTPDEWGQLIYDKLFPTQKRSGGDSFGGGGVGARRGTDFDPLLDAIYRAEGGAQARVPYGMTDFADAGNKFSNERNQALFEQLSQGMVEGSEEYYRTAALVSAQHYWNTFQQMFPEVAGKTFEQLEPEMQQLFVLHMGRWFSPPNAHELNKNWVPNVLSALGHGDVAKEFRAGSGNLIDAWLDGIYAKSGDAEQAANYIAGIFADYLVGQSPPPEGPLADIDKGGANVMEAWVEGAEEGLKDGVPALSSGLEKVKNLFGTIWDKVPEEIKGPIEQAMDWVGGLIEQAENALFKLDEFEEELARIMGGGTSPEDEAQGFMNRLAKALDEKLEALDDPLNRFVDMVSSAALHLGEVVKAVSSGDWVGAVLSILMETESFAKAMELIGKVLDPVVKLFDFVLKPIINGILKLWNGIIDALVSISIFGWQPFKGLEESKIDFVGEGDKSDKKEVGSGGRQISEITGPTRDLLVDLLSPLANFGQIVAPIQDIRNILYERLPNFDAFGMDFAGAGAIGGDIIFEPGSIVINSSGTSAAELSRDMLDAIEREMARRINFGIRGRGGR